ncbi:DUF4439 domain-containing protein [Cellulomonas sp. HZM]|uniref:DUF4439 domain-containing protein n=1 Tax=Cellulomonas sp. HZM TaxID=1454010 RepID=UPI0006901600|nr:DUF4439 domain-containing protein [Cellulomonas sp. HZM]
MTTQPTTSTPHDDGSRGRARDTAGVARITPAGRGRGAVRALVVALATALVASCAACSVRLESAPYPEPSPGPVEQVRARTLGDALALEADARAALATRPGAAVADVLDDVVAFSADHASQLGPAYDSGLTPSATATSSAPTRTTPSDVLTELAATTRDALADADGVADADLARLVASIAAARDQLTRRLATATEAKVPDLDVVVTPSPAPSVTGSPAPEPTPSPEQTDAAQATSADDLAPLVVAHDQAGFAYEVIAAQQSGSLRTAARAAAAQHRDEAQRWAVAAGVAETAQDPRRASYTLPDGLDKGSTARRLARALEGAVADAAATLVARTPAGQRSPFVDALRTANAAARTWGAAPVPFPGMPERADG